MPTDNDPQISQIAVKDASPPLLPLRNLCNLRMVPTDALNMLPVGTVPCNRASCGGMTLIELLVVMVILSIVTAATSRC